MEPGQLLFTLLSQAAPVAALLPHVRKGKPEVKIYPVEAPQPTPLPYVCYQLISLVPDGGPLCELDDQARVQLSIYGNTYAEVCAIAKACRKALHHQAALGAWIELANQFDHPRIDASQAYYCSQDYLLELPLEPSAPVVTPPPTGGGGETTPPDGSGGETTPPPTTELVEGVLPLSGAWVYQTGTLNPNKIQRVFQTDSNLETIESYERSDAAVTDIVVEYPAGFYLDSVAVFDGNGSAQTEGTLPIEILCQPRAGGALQSLGFFTGAEFGHDLPPYAATARTEISELRLRMTGPRAVWMKCVRVNGAYPKGYTLPAYRNKGTSLESQFGVGTYWFYVIDPQNFTAGPAESNVVELGAFGRKRFFPDIAKIQDATDPTLFRIEPSYEASWESIMRAMPTCLAFVGNFKQNKSTFVYTDPDTGAVYTDTDIAHNALTAKDADRDNPESYRLWGEWAWQLGAREGSVSYPLTDLRFATTSANGWAGQAVHQNLTGLRLKPRVMFGNEPLKYWKGPDAQLSGKRVAIMQAVVRDGYNKTMTGRVGLMNADPSWEPDVQLLFDPDLSAVRAFCEQWALIYGRNADGTIKNFPSRLDLHWYSRDPVTGAGVAWDKSDLPKALADLQRYLATVAPNVQLTLSEYGYSYDHYADRSFVAPSEVLTSEQRAGAFILSQGFWNCRNDIESANLYDFRAGDHYQPTQAGVPWDLTCDNRKRLAADYVRDVRALVQGYGFAGTLDQGDVLINRHTKAGQPDVFEVLGTGSFSIPVAGASKQTRFAPTKGGWGVGITTPIDGTITGTAAGEMTNYYRAG